MKVYHSASVFAVSANQPVEDAFDCRSDEGFFVLCDGHGGSECAHHVAKNIWPEFEAQKQWLDVGDAFALSLRNLDSYFAKRPTISRCGTCVLVCYLEKESMKLYVANVGDCRAVLCRVDKDDRQIKAIQLTKDHNVYNSAECDLVRERSRDQDAIRPPSHARHSKTVRVAGTLLVTRALGDHYLKSKERSFPPFVDNLPYVSGEPEVFCYQLSDHDLFFVMGSDGLWDMLTNIEAVAAVLGSDERSPAEQLQRIWKQRVCEYHRLPEDEIEKIPKGSRRRKVHDDATAIVVMLRPPQEFFRCGNAESVRIGNREMILTFDDDELSQNVDRNHGPGEADALPGGESSSTGVSPASTPIANDIEGSVKNNDNNNSSNNNANGNRRGSAKKILADLRDKVKDPIDEMNAKKQVMVGKATNWWQGMAVNARKALMFVALPQQQQQEETSPPSSDAETVDDVDEYDGW